MRGQRMFWSLALSRRAKQCCICASVLALAVLACLLTAARAASVPAARWEAQGEMSEACTCQVPCTCNFGQGPSPHHYCWSLASFHIEKGHYGAVSLNGLHLVRAHGNQTTVWYIDDSATAGQAQALRSLVRLATHGDRKNPRHFERAHIVQTVGGGRFLIKIGGHGGFDADEIMGMDGKNPIVVENMTAWNVQHDIKGKTTRLRYKDEFGNRLDFERTSANLGKFDWTDTTRNPF
ncbi:MAG: DUF1326 domain-containing protein [Terriglobia bacterium]